VIAVWMQDIPVMRLWKPRVQCMGLSQVTDDVTWAIDMDVIRMLTVGLQGKLFVRADSKIFRFQNGKSESLFLQRKNPRRIAWTVLCRRQRRKGISEVCWPCTCNRRSHLPSIVC